MPKPGSGILGQRGIYLTISNRFAVRANGRYVGVFPTLEAAIARRDYKTPKVCPTCGHRTYYGS